MIDEWIIKFQTYSQAAQLDQGQLIDIIEQNIDPSIIQKIIKEDIRPMDPADYLTKVWNIGQKRQLTRFLGIAGSSRQRDPNAMDISALDTISDQESEMEINTFTKGKGKARTPNCNKNRSLVSIAENQDTWLKHTRSPWSDARNAIGLEEATSRDAPRHQRSEQPLKNLLHLGIRDPAPFKKWALMKPRPFSMTCTMLKTSEKPKRFDQSGWSKWLSIGTYNCISKL